MNGRNDVKCFFSKFIVLLVCIMFWNLSSNDVLVVEAEEIAFEDVTKYDYYYTPVCWALEQGITSGLRPGEFGSNASCTRSQVVTFLWRKNGCPEPKSMECVFDDIQESDYYYKAVLWAVEEGITNGATATSFLPDKVVTRGEVITFIHRAEGKPGYSIENSFSDVSSQDYFYDSVLWALENKVTSGYKGDLFAPKKECTRSQVVTFLWRITKPVEVNALEHGVSPSNSGIKNSIALQNLIDSLTNSKGVIYIPSGEYEFAEGVKWEMSSYCIGMKSNISIIGDGDTTILKPVGRSEKGLDMFFFNDCFEKGYPWYLENCRFENFVIDGSGTSCDKYTTSGKGFMFNLFKNCHWKNVTVKNTDATGFGVDCPIDSSITNCIAENCGKAATTMGKGASGFGIGFGYSNDESITISNCQSYGNRKFGFFFEHQGRFSSWLYTAETSKGFVISDCTATGNYYNFGGIQAVNTLYEDCYSSDANKHGFYFENSRYCDITNCVSENEYDTSFVIFQSSEDGGNQEVRNITYNECTSRNSLYGAKIVTSGSNALMSENAIRNCSFYSVLDADIYVYGNMNGLELTGNVSDVNKLSLGAIIENLNNSGNSWN